MSAKLSEQLEFTLRSILSDDNAHMIEDDVHTLIKLGLITPKISGGWIVNTMGKAYLKEHKQLV